MAFSGAVKRAVVLVVDDDEGRRRRVSALLPRGRLEVMEAALPHVRGVARAHRPDAIVVMASEKDATRVLGVAREVSPVGAPIPLVLIAAPSSEALAIAALKAGVADYLVAPVEPTELLASLDRLLSVRSGGATAASPDDVTAGSRIVGDSAAIRELRAFIQEIGPTDTSVLITGDTGTGKELVAEAIHGCSARQRRPFVSLNCAAIPDSLLESELFGHERGAFTGAHAAREGKLRRADGGTIFFDEIGDMQPYAQAKILRAIESKEIEPLGGHAGARIDVRMLAATNQDLDRLMDEGRFRKDLYFRLSVVRVHLPPLRERLEDVPVLVSHYIRENNRRFNRAVEGVTDDVLGQLLRYDWPGNVRELKNVVEAMFVRLHPDTVRAAHLPAVFGAASARARALPVSERTRMLSALFAANWNKSKAAEQLHWSRMTLYRKMAKYHVMRTDVTGGDTPM